ncbi:MAG: hypothetical protein IK083_07300 [Abditibacteriota bacterium]|jgi:hypothetical protein|nr:hypothetical protein [Abditibacteriota bacterium]
MKQLFVLPEGKPALPVGKAGENKVSCEADPGNNTEPVFTPKFKYRDPKDAGSSDDRRTGIGLREVRVTGGPRARLFSANDMAYAE